MHGVEAGTGARDALTERVKTDGTHGVQQRVRGHDGVADIGGPGSARALWRAHGMDDGGARVVSAIMAMAHGQHETGQHGHGCGHDENGGEFGIRQLDRFIGVAHHNWARRRLHHRYVGHCNTLPLSFLFFSGRGATLFGWLLAVAGLGVHGEVCYTRRVMPVNGPICYRISFFSVSVSRYFFFLKNNRRQSELVGADIIARTLA